MFKLGFLLILGIFASSSADLTSLDQFSLDAFTKVFRQSLLLKVATQWNKTLDESAKLKPMMATCRTTISNQANRCTACTQRRCSATPQFTDYLKLLLNPVDLLKGPLNEVGKTLHVVVDLLGDRGKDFVNAMGGLATSAYGGVKDGLSSAFHGLQDGLSKVGDAFKDLGSSIGHGVVDTGTGLLNGVKDVGNTLSHGITSVGHALEHAGSSIIHSIGSIFGKKREVSAQIRRCMQGCSECHPMLQTNQQEMIREVCGDALIQKNASVARDIQLVGGVYQDVIDKTHPIVQKVEFDHASLNNKMEATVVYLTVFYHGHYVRYRSDVPYKMMDVPTSAAAMAEEYWMHTRD